MTHELLDVVYRYLNFKEACRKGVPQAVSRKAFLDFIADLQARGLRDISISQEPGHPGTVNVSEFADIEPPAAWQADKEPARTYIEYTEEFIPDAEPAPQEQPELRMNGNVPPAAALGPQDMQKARGQVHVLKRQAARLAHPQARKIKHGVKRRVAERK